MRYIELKLREMNQLFNSMDPAPFNERDLDHDAEEFIVSWAQEYPIKDSLSLRVYLDQWPGNHCKEILEKGVHNYFAYRTEISRMEFRRMMKQGRTSFLTGLVFLGLCFFVANTVAERMHYAWVDFFRESLTIVGWVAMWRPIQTYLYDWWPAYQQIRIYRKLSRMPVEVLQKAE